MKARVCQRGHLVRGTNVVMSNSHGKRRPRCRRCVVRYQREYMRKVRRRRKR